MWTSAWDQPRVPEACQTHGGDKAKPFHTCQDRGVIPTHFLSCFKGKSESTLPGVLGTVAWWSHSLFGGTEKQSPLLKALSLSQACFSLHPLWLLLLPPSLAILPFFFPSSLPSSLPVSFPCFSPLPPASFPFLLSLFFPTFFPSSPASYLLSQVSVYVLT